jgi:hypothetical protein
VEVARQVAEFILSDIPRMSPWNGANAIILEDCGEAMSGRCGFPGADMTPIGGALPHRECYRRFCADDWAGVAESEAKTLRVVLPV